jgi:multidrug resistance efflux pump
VEELRIETAPRVSGPIVQVAVHDNQEVRKVEQIFADESGITD